MSRSYRKHSMMRVEKRSYNHKEMNRSFRRISIEDTPANGNAYKKSGRINNNWDWKPFYYSKKDATREWRRREREGRNYECYTLEEYLQKWEKWCHRK